MLKYLIYSTLVFIASCKMVGSDYHEPSKKIVSHWYAAPAVTEQPIKSTFWWSQFHDATLNAIIKQGYDNNLSLQAAGTNVLQTRAQLAQSVGQLYPQQQIMQGTYAYNRIGGSSFERLLPSSFQTLLLGFSANWEIDFWGKYRRAIQAKDAQFLGSIAAYDNALVTLSADIATTYINIRIYETQRHITQVNIKVQKMALKIAQARYHAGQSSLVDVEQALTELAQTEASLPQINFNLQKQRDALAVLLGTVPDKLPVITNSRGIPRAPRSLAVGIPRELLARRPDIQQARLEAVAQSASTGAIKASLFPALSLNGIFAFSSNNIGTSSLGDLFNWSNRNINAGGGFNWPLLNYGQITNMVRAQDALFQQALLNYQNTVLKAQQEVQDNITAYLEARKTARYLEQANRSAMQSLKLSLIRYQEGETDFTPVLNAEQQQLSVQTSLANAQGAIPQAFIALYRALGGGWELRGTNDVISQQIKAEMAARVNWGTLLQTSAHLPPVTTKQRAKTLFLPKW